MHFCHHLYLHIVLIFMNTKHIEDVNFHYLKAYWNSKTFTRSTFFYQKNMAISHCAISREAAAYVNVASGLNWTTVASTFTRPDLAKHSCLSGKRCMHCSCLLLVMLNFPVVLHLTVVCPVGMWRHGHHRCTMEMLAQDINISLTNNRVNG